MTPQEKQDTYKKFKEAVNMTASEIEAFLKTPPSKAVGQKKDGDSESIGHESGRKIVAILRKAQSALTDDDYAHMKRVNSYVARHLGGGGPKSGKKNSVWRYSLMNWGHDPCKA